MNSVPTIYQELYKTYKEGYYAALRNKPLDETWEAFLMELKRSRAESEADKHTVKYKAPPE